MSDFRNFFGNKSAYLKASDLGMVDVTVTIREVGVGIIGKGDNADQKPVFYFEELDKGLYANKTNCETIGALYGWDDADVIGQRITLFATQCQNSAGTIVPCIRVRPVRPDEQRYAAPVRQLPPKPRAGQQRNEQRTRDARHARPFAQQPARSPVQSAVREAGRDQATALRELARPGYTEPLAPIDEFDTSIADAEFGDELSRAFKTRNFADQDALDCVEHVTRNQGVAELYDLTASQRTELIARVAGGRYDRFRKPTREPAVA